MWRRRSAAHQVPALRDLPVLDGAGFAELPQRAMPLPDGFDPGAPVTTIVQDWITRLLRGHAGFPAG
ncbi:hypothetical protein [Thermomonospora umbrina]|uniref:hypothetical protein n=1 Tax=Thermomonospora umbrina TaxID=111806 RepID=UPI000E22D0FC|nr:hypothetical protein [Thermomonospora umbrina]